MTTPWYDPSWQYRKSHVIIHAAGAGTLYQKKIIVHYGSGTSTGDDVYCDSHCKTDFGDIRFTTDDGTTLLDYWMQEKTDSNNAIFWVEVADDLTSVDKTIYIYYGNASATTSSNGKNTFLIFDHFDGSSLDLSYWSVLQGNIPPVSDSEVEIFGASGWYNVIQTINTDGCTTGREVQAKARVVAISTGHGTQTIAVCPSTQYAGWYADSFGVYMARDSAFHSASNPITGNYIFRTRATSTYQEFYAIGAETCGPITVTAAWTPVADYLNISLGPPADIFYDWVFERKFVDPEPTNSTWETEEEGPTKSKTYSIDMILKLLNIPKIYGVDVILTNMVTREISTSIDTIFSPAPPVPPITGETLVLKNLNGTLWCKPISWKESQECPPAIRPLPLALSERLDADTWVLKPRTLEFKVRLSDREKGRFEGIVANTFESIYDYGTTTPSTTNTYTDIFLYYDYGGPNEYIWHYTVWIANKDYKWEYSYQNGRYVRWWILTIVCNVKDFTGSSHIEPQYPLSTVTIDAHTLDFILDFERTDKHPPMLPEWINQTEAVDSYLWNECVLDVAYTYRATNNEKYLMDITLRNHSKVVWEDFIHNLFSIAGEGNGVWVSSIEAQWDDINWVKPWKITVAIKANNSEIESRTANCIVESYGVDNNGTHTGPDNLGILYLDELPTAQTLPSTVNVDVGVHIFYFYLPDEAISFYDWGVAGNAIILEKNTFGRESTLTVLVTGNCFIIPKYEYIIEITCFTIALFSELESDPDIINYGSILIDEEESCIPSDYIIASTPSSDSHTLEYIPLEGYIFDHWESSENITITDPNANSTTFTIEGSSFELGCITAIYSLLCITLALSSSSGLEEIVNGGFETGDSTGWIVYLGEITTNNPHSGNYCAKAIYDSEAGGIYLDIHQDFTSSIPIDSIASFNVWIRSSETDNTWVAFSNGITIYNYKLTDTTNDWKEYNLFALIQTADYYGNIPTGNLIYVEIFNGNETEATAIDDMSLKEIGNYGSIEIDGEGSECLPDDVTLTDYDSHTIEFIPDLDHPEYIFDHWEVHCGNVTITNPLDNSTSFSITSGTLAWIIVVLTVTNSHNINLSSARYFWDETLTDDGPWIINITPYELIVGSGDQFWLEGNCGHYGTEEKIVNGEFEDGTTGWTLGLNAALSTDNPHSGTYDIIFPLSEQYGYGDYVSQTLVNPVRGNDLISGGFWFRNPEPQPIGVVEVDVTFAGYGTYSWWYQTDNGDHDWTYADLLASIIGTGLDTYLITDIKIVRFHPLFGSTTIYIDDVSLIATSASWVEGGCNIYVYLDGHTPTEPYYLSSDISWGPNYLSTPFEILTHIGSAFDGHRITTVVIEPVVGGDTFLDDGRTWGLTGLNLGTITVDGSPYSLPNTIPEPDGDYTILYTPIDGYIFDHWEVHDNITIDDDLANPTTIHITGDGSLVAIYTYIKGEQVYNGSLDELGCPYEPCGWSVAGWGVYDIVNYHSSPYGWEMGGYADLAQGLIRNVPVIWITSASCWFRAKLTQMTIQLNVQYTDDSYESYSRDITNEEVNVWTKWDFKSLLNPAKTIQWIEFSFGWYGEGGSDGTIDDISIVI